MLCRVAEHLRSMRCFRLDMYDKDPGNDLLTSACTIASLLYKLPSSSATQGGCKGSPDRLHRVHLANLASTGLTCSMQSSKLLEEMN